jgi:hypothetical protein
MILLEIQYDQGEAVRHLARAVFSGAQVVVLQDLAGLDRLVMVEVPQNQSQSLP